jgi:protein phosphatase
LNAKYGFWDEVCEKYDEDLYLMFSDIFSLLPLSSVVNEKIFVVHGGLTQFDDLTLKEIKE